MSEYKVQFEVFEGPLDLLLYLVKKQEVDIYEVNLTRLAEKFVEYLDVMRELDLDVAGEFVVMASTLMLIKSRELLPTDQQAESSEEDEGEDPRWELIRQLVEYRKFKDAAAQMQTLEARQESIYPRNPPRPEFDNRAGAIPGTLSVFDLVGAVTIILKRFQERDSARDIFDDKFTVSEKIDWIRAWVERRASFKFSELFEGAISRTEVVVTFLALLELIRLGLLVVFQPEPFSDIEVAKAPALPVPVQSETAQANPPEAQPAPAPSLPRDTGAASGDISLT